jgi:hypothetical protein
MVVTDTSNWAIIFLSSVRSSPLQTVLSGTSGVTSGCASPGSAAVGVGTGQDVLVDVLVDLVVDELELGDEVELIVLDSVGFPFL